MTEKKDDWRVRRRSGGLRGDLARLIGELPLDEARDSAALLGFEAAPAPEEKEAPAPPPKRSQQVEESSELPWRGLRTPFWRVEAVEHLGPAAPPVERERRPGITHDDALNPGRSLFLHPPCPLITPWAALEPRLRAVLSGERPGQGLDVEAVVRALGRGEVLHALPRQRRRAWPGSLQVWIDRSARHFTMEADQHEVLRQLTRLCGPSAVAPRVLDPQQQAFALTAAGHFAPKEAPRPGAVVLVLGDLGACSNSPTALAWALTGERLLRAGVRPVALVPVGLDRLDARVADAWTTLPWEARSAPGLSKDERDARADRLLRLASPAALIQPGLLRALRLRLPDHEADLGTEFDALTRPDVRAYDGTGLVLSADASARLREAFAATESPALRQQVRDLIRDWHKDLPAELLRAETLFWAARDTEVAPPGDLRDAMAFIARVETTVSSAVEGREAQSWRRLARATLAGLPEVSYRQGELAPVLHRLWREVHRDDPAAIVPEGVPADVLRGAEGSSPPARQWSLRQIGDSLNLFPQDGDPNPAVEPLLPGSPITTLTLREHLWMRWDGPRQQHRVGRGRGLPLRSGKAVEIWGESSRVALCQWTPEPWAQAAGRDEYGLWADLEVKGVVQRMRWIPPGRFWMGSPEGEAGRDDDEGSRHEVELTRGFWLGETPVTQGLWEAVMGKNPSRFVSSERPVERVSWKDCVGFCGHLNEEFEGAGVRLPTEAEWEYACRAGTGGATWLGELEICGENDAPLLDGIAWYGGNGGEGYELERGEDSRNWPRKQYEHTKAGTRTVKGKRANPWGLYDMLGNVYEWCTDAYERYPEWPQVDPVIRTGADRVFRGGSWFSYARYLRAAHRHWSSPEYLDDDLGFRLARGPEPGGGAQPGQGAAGAASARDEPKQAPKRSGQRGRR